MKNILNRIKFIFQNKIKPVFRRAAGVLEIRYALWAVLTVLFAELLSSGPLRAAAYPFVRPLPFITAVFIVLCTYSFSLLSKKRLGVFLLVEAVWVGISIANCVLLSFRISPLSATDFSVLFSAFSIIPLYLSVVWIILICVAIIAAVALAVFCMIRIPSSKPNYKRVIPEMLVCVLLCAGALAASVLVNRNDMKKMNLPDAYREYGFVYCFSLSTADRGIDKPGKYSENAIADILDGIDRDVQGESPNRPNVVIVQLESFMDTDEIIGLETTADPIPNFRKLKEAYPSGTLTVPVSGGGTVNTEFEVLCGIPISSFGLGEYPYETVLRENPCESLAYYLREIGYTAHAIHNHTGTFYNRYTVMQNLGFDTFTPVEYMSGVRRNILGWAKDTILTDEIMTAMGSTEGVDFVYTVSVQPHGKYVSEPGDYGDIKASGDFDSMTLAAIEYYVNQIYETDRFVGELISEISMSGEDTVVVFFGDHQPSLGLSEGRLEGGSLYTTEYVIWSNFGLHGEDKDLCSYELSSHLLRMLGIEGGLISQIHNDAKADEEILNALAYDILFGEKYAYEDGAFPYEIPEITYGVREITAVGAYIHNDTLYILGDAFTEASCAVVDGRRRDTIYINPNLIVCADVSEAETVSVAQVAVDGTEFSEISCPVFESPEELEANTEAYD